MIPAFITLLCLVLMVDSQTTQTTQASSVTFSCGGRQCPSGQDCLQVNGTSRCMDPCDHYTPLDDAWRATDNMGYLRSYQCDFKSEWQGWYRLFLGNSSVQMPERCAKYDMCGTQVPLWLQTPHPQLSAGIIQAQVCGSSQRGCCGFKENPIHVKACPGNYYIYKFIKPSFCPLAYCADVNTKIPVCKTCSAAETCVSNGTVWRCEGTSTRHLTTPPTETELTTSTTETSTRAPTTSTTGCMQTGEADVFFLIDQSGSIGSDDFIDMKKFMLEFITTFRVSPQHVRVGVAKYSSSPKLTIDVTDHSDSKTLEKAVRGIVQSGGGTMTGRALTFMGPLFTRADQSRGQKVPQFLVVITDGKSGDQVKIPAETLRARGIIVYAIGVRGANEAQLLEIAGDPAKKFSVNNFDALNTIKDALIRDICSEVVKPSELVCGREQMRLTVPKRILEGQGLNGSSAHLVDPRCHEQVDFNGTVTYLVDRREVCGNVVKNNGTHVTYSNIVFVFHSNRSDPSIIIPRSFPFSCIFPLDDITSLDAAIGYQPLGVGVVSSGDPTKVSMTLYTEPDFSEAFPAGPVRLPLGSALHVGVSVNSTEYDGFGLLLETCYLTNSPNASDSGKHFLIENRCAVDSRHVKVIESGASLRARFSALLFLYHGTYEDVYLHCSISMCDRSSAPCSPSCSRRQARSAASSDQLAVAVGPISWF